jgi:predicted glutamine amidotransferase
MCRLIVYVGSADASVSLADLLVRPTHSIMKQSYGCRERFGDGLSGLPSQLNADGFGVAWYERPPADTATALADSRPATQTLQQWEMPGVYTSTAPAWNDPNLGRLCCKLNSHLVFGHIRAASLGSGVTTNNCHPFSSSRFAFMHNGHIGAFVTLKRRILNGLSDRALSGIRGTTDSEHLFAMFLTEVEAEEERAAAAAAAAPDCARPAAPAGGRLPPEALQMCLLRTFRRLVRLRAAAGVTANSLLNVCVTDGATVLATRLVIGAGKPASLYFTCGSGWAPARSRDAAGGLVGGGTACGVGASGAGATSASDASDASAGASRPEGGAAANPAVYLRRPPCSSGASTVEARSAATGCTQAVSGCGQTVACGPAASAAAAPTQPTISGPGVDFEMLQGEKRGRCVIVASERLTGRDEDWLPVPPDTMLLIHPSLTVMRLPLGGGVLEAPDEMLDGEAGGCVGAAAAAGGGVLRAAAGETKPQRSGSLACNPCASTSITVEGTGGSAPAAATGASTATTQGSGTSQAAAAAARCDPAAALPSAAPPIYLRKRAKPDVLPAGCSGEAACCRSGAGVCQGPAKHPRVVETLEDGGGHATAPRHPVDSPSLSSVRLQMTCQGRPLPQVAFTAGSGLGALAVGTTVVRPAASPGGPGRLSLAWQRPQVVHLHHDDVSHFRLTDALSQLPDGEGAPPLVPLPAPAERRQRANVAAAGDSDAAEPTLHGIGGGSGRHDPSVFMWDGADLLANAHPGSGALLEPLRADVLGAGLASAVDGRPVASGLWARRFKSASGGGAGAISSPAPQQVPSHVSPLHFALLPPGTATAAAGSAWADPSPAAVLAASRHSAFGNATPYGVGPLAPAFQGIPTR